MQRNAVTGFIHVREMSGKFKFFQGQGILREFCDMSGKDEILQKCLGILHFNLMKLECLIPMYLFFCLFVCFFFLFFFCLFFFVKFIKFSAPILSGKFEFVS